MAIQGLGNLGIGIGAIAAKLCMQTILHGDLLHSASETREKCACSRFFFCLVFCMLRMLLKHAFVRHKTLALS